MARYYKDALQNPNEQSAELTAEISEMADHINWEQYAKILMFFLYFTRNNDLIAKLISNANQVFAQYSPANLEKDVDFANDLYKTPPKTEWPSGDIRTNREDRRQQLDESDRRLPSSPEGKKIRYSQELSDNDKLDIAIKNLELLGQIVRNFPGSLKADAKLNIARCTYLLGLRTEAAFLDLIQRAVSHYRQAFAQMVEAQVVGLEEPSAPRTQNAQSAAATVSPAKADQSDAIRSYNFADDLFLLLARAGVLGMTKKVSMCVGSPELDQTYSDVLDSIPDTNAVQLIDLSIRLDHFRGFPVNQVREMNDRTAKNLFAHQVLTDLVVNHLMFFEVDFRTRQQLGSLLGFRSSDPRLLDTRAKLLKEPEKKS